MIIASSTKLKCSWTSLGSLRHHLKSLCINAVLAHQLLALILVQIEESLACLPKNEAIFMIIIIGTYPFKQTSSLKLHLYP